MWKHPQHISNVDSSLFISGFGCRIGPKWGCHIFAKDYLEKNLLKKPILLKICIYLFTIWGWVKLYIWKCRKKLIKIFFFKIICQEKLLWPSVTSSDSVNCSLFKSWFLGVDIQCKAHLIKYGYCSSGGDVGLLLTIFCGVYTCIHLTWQSNFIFFSYCYQ